MECNKKSCQIALIKVLTLNFSWKRLVWIRKKNHSTGQTLNDGVLTARHSIAGQGLAKAVCKATTEELIGPKKTSWLKEVCICFQYNLVIIFWEQYV